MTRPAPLWSAWERVARGLAGAPQVALFFDFDGTLAPIARHPAGARLRGETRRVLQQFRRHPRISVGVVSGRSLRDLRGKIGLRSIYYVGSHGLEWAEPAGRRHLKVSARWEAYFRRLGARLKSELGRLPGIYVERKTLSVAVHYRNAPPAAARRAQKAMERVAKESNHPLRLVHGKRIVEVLPPGRMDKGRAVTELVRRLQQATGQRPLVIYIGDDQSDESVFPRLGRRDFGIHVGTGHHSRADYRLRSPAEVTRFLDGLGEVMR